MMMLGDDEVEKENGIIYLISLHNFNERNSE